MGQGLQYGDVFQEKYTIEEEVGRGSFGAVYRAREEGRAETVAVKVLLPWVEADTEMRHRFKREAKLAQHLTNPHGIQIHEFGETPDGTLYLVMEFLEGRPLNLILEEDGRMSTERVAHIARQTLISLAEAHKTGIVHRDLKPPNIFICTNKGEPDFVKVFDFGIAKVIGGGDDGTLRETTKLTVRGGLVGTPVYMSPEQCRGEDLTPASDLYSLGVMMYEMLTGDVPFDHSNPVQIMIMHNQHAIPPLPDEIANTTVGKAVMRALEKDLKDRFTCAEEFIAALDGTEYQPPAGSAGSKTGGKKPQLMRDIAYRETVSLQVPDELLKKGVPEEVTSKIPTDLMQQTAGGAQTGGKSWMLPAVLGICGVVIIALLSVIVILLVQKS